MPTTDQNHVVGSRSDLSVILPNYNHARFITRAITALVEQDLPPDEILVLDDASTDNSRDVIAALAARYPTVSLVTNTVNKGVAARSQQGLEMARGRYVYSAASDDWVLPGFFRLAFDFLARFPHTGLFCGESVLLDGDTGRFIGMRPAVRPRFSAGEITPEAVRRLLAHSDNWILTGSAILRRAAVLEAGGFDAELGSFGDGYIVRKIALKHGFCFAPVAVSAWQIFQTGESRNSALIEQNARNFLERVPRRIEADPDFPAWYADLFCNRWRFGAARLALNAEPMRGEILLAMGAPTPLDTRMIAFFAGLPLPAKLIKYCILAWLSIRLRPTSFSRLAITAAMRMFEKQTWADADGSAGNRGGGGRLA